MIKDIELRRIYSANYQRTRYRRNRYRSQLALGAKCSKCQGKDGLRFRSIAGKEPKITANRALRSMGMKEAINHIKEHYILKCMFC